MRNLVVARTVERASPAHRYPRDGQSWCNGPVFLLRPMTPAREASEEVLSIPCSGYGMI